MALQVAAGDLLVTLDAFSCDAVLYLEILLLGDIFKRVAGVELGELDKGSALAGGIGKRVGKHGAGDILVSVDGVGQLVLIAVVGVIAHKGVVVFKPYLFCGGIKTEINGECRLCELPCVHCLPVALGHLLGVDHAVEHDMGHEV